MSTLSYRSIKNIGYDPPKGYNFEYCKFERKETELEDNEIEAPSSDEDECDDEQQEEDEEYEVPSECQTTDDSSSEISECDVPLILKKGKRVCAEKVYSVVLQEEDFLPE
jgi:hypothetical protein